MAKSLKNADLNTLVLESGRKLEQAARKIVPDKVDADGKPLMLGPRMYLLRKRLDPKVWGAYQDWARQRNAYTHGEIEDIADQSAFHSDYKLVLSALQALAKPEVEQEAGILTYVLISILIVALLAAYYAC